MTVSLSPIGGAAAQFFDNNGQPLSGGRVYTYAAGTTTPQATYTSSSGATPHSNPIVLNSAGRVPGGEIWLTEGQSYKFTIETAEAVLIGTFDNIQTSVDDATNVAYTIDLTGGVPQTVQTKLDQYVSILDFGAVGDGVTDDTAAIQAAINTGYNITTDASRKTYRITSPLRIVTTYQQIDMCQSTFNLDDATGLLSHIIVGNNVTRANAIAIRNTVFTRSQAATAGAAIYANYVGLLTVENCRIFGNTRIFRGIYIERGIICYLIGNYIQNTVGKGIYLLGTGTGADATNDITITGNRIEFTGQEGLATWDFVEGLYVRSNIFYSTYGAAVALNASTDANGLVSFKFEGNDYDTILATEAFFISKVSNITIANSWFSNNTGTNLRIEPDANSVVVLGGQIYTSAGQIGIQIGGDDVSVVGLQMLGGGQGIALKSTAARVFIDGNAIRNMTVSAINALEGPTEVNIGSNAFGNNAVDISAGALSPTVASVDFMALLGGHTVYNVSGTTDFGNLASGYAGRTVTLIFTGVLTVFNSLGGDTTIQLNGGANFTTAAGNTLTLAHNGVRWYEVARKV